MQISVGYNRSGQDFFDMLDMYRQVIHSYYFSPTWTRDKMLDYIGESVYMADFNTFGIPGNILFNNERVDDVAGINADILRTFLAMSALNIKAATVLNQSCIDSLKNVDPDIQIHLSTAMPQRIRSVYDLKNRFDIKSIYCINMRSEQMFSKLSNEIRDLGIKIKVIANEGCMWNREHFSKYMFDEKLCERYDVERQTNGCGRRCYEKFKGEYAWLNLTRMALTKEFVEMFNDRYDIIKLASRDAATGQINRMIAAWAWPGRTKEYCGVIFPLGIPDEFVNKRVLDCNHKCKECLFCKEIYEKHRCITKEERWTA